MQGEVVGINTRGGGNDLGFAVPINVAKDVVRQILDRGKVMRSTIGLTFQPLQDLEEFFDVGKTEGAVIGSVESGSAAEVAGVQAQDLLIQYNGHQVRGRYPEELFELRRMIADTPVGDTATLLVKRDGEMLTFKVETRELTTIRSDEVNFEKWGLVGQNVTSRLARRENLKSTAGVYVTGVRAGEAAAKGKVTKGDVIVKCGEATVADVAALQKLYDESVEKRDARVLLRIRRGPSESLRLLKVTYEDEEESAERATEKSETSEPLEVPEE
jgi:serine protease Do